MAIASILPMKAARVLGGFDIPHDASNPEGAGQVYLAGAPLVFSSGNLVEGTTDSLTGIVGVAENPGQNLAVAGFYAGTSVVAGITVPITGAPNQGPMIIPALPGVVFEGNLAATTAGDPDQTSTLAQTDVGSTFDLAKGATSKLWYLNRTLSGNKRAVVVGLKDAIGTTSGRVYFMLLLTAGDTLYA